ncbi:MAG TPA: efflux RND transporter periplasmic adaptor subunit [Tepidisphaeraceae bacterium]|nr:efflux RND transporter periplasmic adaptor subunit [Tepidisphaeraceae bacterium]
MIRWIVVLLVLGIGAAGAAKWYTDRTEKQAPSFRTQPVKRGDILATISSTGTIEPEEVVDVGAQVAGQIINFGNDANGSVIDYGSPVEADAVLAKIDDSLYQADFKSATAQVEQAKAGVLRAEADLGQLKARLEQAQRDWDRAQTLGPSEALAQTSYDSYKAAFEIAKANVAVGEAQLTTSKTAVPQAEAALYRVQRNLGYCTIKSPVKGIIIDRRVNIGQTVVASLNAPSLFLIAKDLTRMELWVPVNEADIGQVKVGQPVSFTVDAFPGQKFHGEVGKVRLNAVMTQNVVTYTVEVTTDNSDGKLLPYLTANVSFETGNKEGVLLVPNAALRWSPRPEQIAPAEEPAAGSSGQAASGGGEGGRRGRRGGGGGQNAGGPTSRRSASEDTSRGTVWVQDGEFVKAINLRLGIADPSFTEVLSTNLPEGTELIVGEQRAEVAAPTGPASPFMPTFPGGRGGGGGRRGL